MSRRIGLKDIYTAKVLTDIKGETPITTYDIPRKLARSLTAKISVKSNSQNVYSDDVLEESQSSFDSVEVEIGVNDLTIEDRAHLQGLTVYNGEITESSDNVIPEVALGFKSLKSDGSYEYIWLLKGKFQIPDDEYATKAEKIDSKTPVLKGIFGPRFSDNNYRIIADSKTATEDRISGWFTSVPAPLTSEI